MEPYHDLDSPLEWWDAHIRNQVLEADLCDICSYQVPKEVGKVGTESSTFIEPISQRRDGIEAMFSKQKQAQEQSGDSQTPNSSRGKRKRSLSPAKDLDVIDLTEESPSSSEKVTLKSNDHSPQKTPVKKPKVSH